MANFNLRPKLEFFIAGITPIGPQPAEANCGICYEPLEEDVVQLTGACNHIFHTICIMTWCNGDGPMCHTCPYCRTELFINEDDSDRESVDDNNDNNDDNDHDQDDNIDVEVPALVHPGHRMRVLIEATEAVERQVRMENLDEAARQFRLDGVRLMMEGWRYGIDAQTVAALGLVGDGRHVNVEEEIVEGGEGVEVNEDEDVSPPPHRYNDQTFRGVAFDEDEDVSPPPHRYNDLVFRPVYEGHEADDEANANEEADTENEVEIKVEDVDVVMEDIPWADAETVTNRHEHEDNMDLYEDPMSESDTTSPEDDDDPTSDYDPRNPDA